MEYIKKNWLAIILTITTCIIAYNKDLIIESDKILKDFSFYAILFTFLGFFLTVINTIKITKTASDIQKEALELVQVAKSIEDASNTSDCISGIDSTLAAIGNQNFSEAIIHFQSFRKLTVKNPKVNVTNELTKIEKVLISAKATTPTSPLGTKKKKEITDSLLELKQHMEEKNPVREGYKNDTSKN